MAGPSDPLTLLYELACAFAARIELDELSALVVRKCCQVLDAEATSILLLDPERAELFFGYVAEPEPEAAARLLALRFPADCGIAGTVVRTGRSLRVDDVSSDPRFYAGVDRQTGITTRALLCAPLRTRQGTIGVIQVLNPRSRACFTDDQLAFLEALAGSIAVAIENARMYAQLKQQYLALQEATRDREQLFAIRRELDIARGIQQSILPRAFPHRPDLELFAEMIPAREIGGDFYDFFSVDDARLGLVVGDVSGKGVPAALFMALTRTLVRAAVFENYSPAEAMRRVNELLIPDTRQGMFVTAVYAVLDMESKELTYVNAGHNPPLWVKTDGTIEKLTRTAIALGVVAGGTVKEQTIHLEAGDNLLLYTDGLTESFNYEGEFYGEERLLEAIRSDQCGSADELIDVVEKSLLEFVQDMPAADDLTMLVLRRV